MHVLSCQGAPSPCIVIYAFVLCISPVTKFHASPYHKGVTIQKRPAAVDGAAGSLHAIDDIRGLPSPLSEPRALPV